MTSIRSPMPSNTSDPATVHVPQEMYHWTLYDAPVAYDQWFQAVYKHKDKALWLAIRPTGEGSDHEAAIFADGIHVEDKPLTDAQCLLNILTTGNSVLDGCRVMLESGLAGNESDAYEFAELD